MIRILILTFFTHFFLLLFFMSKLEFIDERLKNAKINQLQLKEICYFFAYDYTASQTAGELGLSRQTINSYYKTIRSSLLEYFAHINNEILDNEFNKKSFELKYIKINSYTFYYLDINNTPYLLDTNNTLFEDIFCFINNDLQYPLINHKKANCAKVLYNTHQNEYFVANYTRSLDLLNKFIDIRLKKFRGINKNNIDIHINESLIRYNNSQNSIFDTLKKTFRL